MDRAYWWRILGRYDVPTEARFLLDTNYDFTGEPRHARVLWQQDFEASGGAPGGPPPLAGRGSLLLDAAHPRSAEYTMPARPGPASSGGCRAAPWPAPTRPNGARAT